MDEINWRNGGRVGPTNGYEEGVGAERIASARMVAGLVRIWSGRSIGMRMARV